jgi:Lon protease-like protein
VTASDSDLPDRLPIFPLAGVSLLPGGQLPLNIFEPRYLDMTRDAMGTHRLIGMVQPIDPDDPSQHPRCYSVGCAGRITQFRETNDGRFLIVLTGVSRFRIAEELSIATRYRQVRADWSAFDLDRDGKESTEGLDGERFLRALKAYLKLQGMSADWQAIERSPLPLLITHLAMLCPFGPSEKQALLEAPTFRERSRTMIALMEMAAIASATQSGDSPPRQ